MCVYNPAHSWMNGEICGCTQRGVRQSTGPGLGTETTQLRDQHRVSSAVMKTWISAAVSSEVSEQTKLRSWKNWWYESRIPVNNCSCVSWILLGHILSPTNDCSEEESCLWWLLTCPWISLSLLRFTTAKWHQDMTKIYGNANNFRALFTLDNER